MAFEFEIPAHVGKRIRAIGFDPAALPREPILGCDLCGSDRQQVVAWTDRYGFSERFVICERCGLVFLNPRPTREAYAEFYEKWYRPLLTALKGTPHQPEQMVTEQRRYAQRVVRLLTSCGLLFEGAVAVDLGGSTGQVALALREEKMDCLVVDPSSDELAVAKKAGLHTQQGFAESWDAGDRKFDLALVCRTVDHFLSIRESLDRIHGMLSKGGLLFIDAVDFDLQVRSKREYRKFLKLDHCYYLADPTMRAFLAASGFEVVCGDISQPLLTYLCRRIPERRDPSGLESYAGSMAVMMRDRLAASRHPVDVLGGAGERLKRWVKRLP